MTPTVRSILLIPLFFALLALLAGYGLQDSHLCYLVQIFSQSGVPNAKNLDKVRLLPARLKLVGLEAVVAAGLILCRWRKLDKKMDQLILHLSSRQIFF